jgi:hypothetical protein
MNEIIRKIYTPVVQKTFGLTFDQFDDYIRWSNGHLPPMEFHGWLVEGCAPFHQECSDGKQFLLSARFSK